MCVPRGGCRTRACRSSLSTQVETGEPTVKPIALIMLMAVHAAADADNRKYAPFSEYEMTRKSEIALARSAAPERISSRATIKVLTRNGYEVAVRGDNAFLCMVMRSLWLHVVG